MDFEITEEQRLLIETARRFAKERVIPVAAACDRESRFPKDVFEEAHKLGLANPTLPTEYGGSGLSDVDSSFVTEELAYGCSGIQTSITANTLGLTPIKLAGSEEQKKKYLGWLASEPIFCSYATTEPSAGSDVAGLQ
jgi:acyl-CoA dehydrogenase